MTTPLSLLPTCSLWIDGARFADGGTPGEVDTDPVALTDLEVRWGRENTLDQPEPGTCTFQVLDVGGGTMFTDKLRIGSAVEVRAEAVIYPDPTVPIFTWGSGFESIAVGAVPPSTATGGAVVVSTEQAKTGARSARIDPSTRMATIVFPPAPYGNDSAWDAVPRSLAGQTWRFGASLWLSQAVLARVRPVGFTRPDPSAVFKLDGYDLTANPSTVGWQDLAGDVLPPEAIWLGVAIDLVAPGWDEMPAGLSWDALAPGGPVLTNRATNPRAISTGSTGWTSNRWFGATGGAGTWSYATGLTTPVPGVTTARRKTWTAAPSNNGDTGFEVRDTSANYFPCTPGDVLTLTAYMRHTSPSGAKELRMNAFCYNQIPASGAVVVGSRFYGPLVTAQSGVWVRVSLTFTIPAGAVGFTAMPDVNNLTAGHTLWAAGDILDGTALQIDKSAAVGPYFDGSTADTATTEYGWTGTVNASTSTATSAPALRWNDMGLAYVDDLLLLAPTAGAFRRSTVFAGRVTDLQSSYDLDVGGTLVDVVAQTHLAELNNRYVGTEPWLKEALSARFARIVVASGQAVDYLIAPSVAGIQMTWRDVDNQPSGDLLHQLAQSVGGALWSASSDVGRPYVWLEDINERPGAYVLAKVGGIVVIIPGTYTDPNRVVVIDACDVLLEPIVWSQTTEDNATRVVVSWQDQTVDEDGKQNPTTRDTTVDDPQAEAATGRRRIQVSTELAAEPDASKVAQSILARVSTPGWRLSGITWQMATTEKLDATTLDCVMRLLDGVTKLGVGIRLTNMPTWAPPASGQDTRLFLEGGTYRNVDGAWILELQTSSAISQGKSTATWDSLPTDWQWDQFSPEISWNDLHGVGYPV